MARWWTSDRLAAWVFAGVLVITFFWVLLDLGSYHWFFGDEWSFLGRIATGAACTICSSRTLSTGRLFRSSCTASSSVSFTWTATARSQARGGPERDHRVILRGGARRAGVRPWTATIVVAVFVLFGPGEQNIVWAFQIGFVGALLFGLVHLLLADHDGPLDRRDALGIAAGVLALMSSAIGILMAVIAGLAALLRRGWRVAFVHTAPLAAAYLIWWLAVRPGYTDTGQGNPSISGMVRWLRSGMTGTFLALGHFRVVAATLIRRPGRRWSADHGPHQARS